MYLPKQGHNEVFVCILEPELLEVKFLSLPSQAEIRIQFCAGTYDMRISLIH